MGGGSWATALAKLLLQNCDTITWYMRRDDRIEDFKHLRHNPAYLTDVVFDIDRINFSSDINDVCSVADTLLFVTPSPYFLSHVNKIKTDISGKSVVSAVKGIVPESNELISDYMVNHFGVSRDRVLVVSGPCHAEEVALDRPSYLTVGCADVHLASLFASVLESKRSHAITSTDVEGIEYGAVLKNVYAIAAGIIHGMKIGDNMTAILISNAIREMERFLSEVAPRTDMRLGISRRPARDGLLALLAQPQFRLDDRTGLLCEVGPNGDGADCRRVLRHKVHLRHQQASRRGYAYSHRRLFDIIQRCARFASHCLSCPTA